MTSSNDRIWLYGTYMELSSAFFGGMRSMSTFFSLSPWLFCALIAYLGFNGNCILQIYLVSLCLFLNEKEPLTGNTGAQFGGRTEKASKLALANSTITHSGLPAGPTTWRTTPEDLPTFHWKVSNWLVNHLFECWVNDWATSCHHQLLYSSFMHLKPGQLEQPHLMFQSDDWQEDNLCPAAICCLVQLLGFHS